MHMHRSWRLERPSHLVSAGFQGFRVLVCGTSARPCPKAGGLGGAATWSVQGFRLLGFLVCSTFACPCPKAGGLGAPATWSVRQYFCVSGLASL